MSAHSDRNRVGAKDDGGLDREGKEPRFVTVERLLWTGTNLSSKKLKALVASVPRRPIRPITRKK